MNLPLWHASDKHQTRYSPVYELSFDVLIQILFEQNLH